MLIHTPTVLGNITPIASGAYNIGSVSEAFNDAYIDRVNLKCDPSGTLEAATKQYVDNAILGENLWDRTGTTLTTHTAGDLVDVSKLKVTEAYFNSEYDNGASGATKTINWATYGNKQKVTLDQSCTFTFTAPDGVCNLILKAVNFGAFTPTFPVSVTWVYGGAPTFATAGTDIISLYYDGSTYWASAMLDTLPTTYNITQITNLPDDGFIRTSNQNGTLVVDTNLTYNPNGITASGNIDWAAGNVTYVPLTGNIQTYIDNAATGDTLVLAAGTYSQTTITANTKVHIRGQGPGITIIQGQASGTAGLRINVAGTVVSDLTMNITGGHNGTTGIMPAATCDIYNVAFTSDATGAAGANILFIYTYGNCTIRNCTFVSTGAIGYAYGVYGDGPSSNVATISDCIFAQSGATTANTIVYNALGTIELNFHNCSFSSTSVTTAGSGVICCNRASGTINLYNCSVSTTEADAVDVLNTAGKITLYNTTLVQNTTSGTISYGAGSTTTMSNVSTLAGSNVIYVPLTDGTLTQTEILTAAIANAASGDTLILAAGTYTITSGMSITLPITIRGQGIYNTTITSSANAINMFDLHTGNVTICDMTITNTGGGSAAIGASSQHAMTNMLFENLYINVSGAGATYGVYSYNMDGITRDCTITTSCTNAASYGFYQSASAWTSTMNVWNCYVNSDSNGGIGSKAFICSSAGGITSTLNLYNCTAVAQSGGTEDAAVWSTTVHDSYASVINAFGCTFNGSDYDVMKNPSFTTPTVTLYDCTLVNNTKLGTVIYGGTIATLGVTASGCIDWRGGNTTYIPLNGVLSTYITNASDGDTLLLSAGTYTITSGLTVDKKLHIMGQGEGITTVTTASDINTITITAANSRISNMSITRTGTPATKYDILTTVDCYVSNCAFVDTSTGGISYAIGTVTAGATITIENCTHIGSGVTGAHFFVDIRTGAGNANIRNCSSLVSAGNAAYSNIAVYAGAGAGTIKIYNSTITALTDATAYTYGVIHTDGGTIEAYNCTFSSPRAGSFDVAQTAGGVLTLYDTTLVNNTTSGTITYGGTVVTSKIGVGGPAVFQPAAQYPLDVYGGNSSGIIDTIKLKAGISTDTVSGAGLLFEQAHSSLWQAARIANMSTKSGISYGQDLLFYTNAGASSTNLTEKMRITWDGLVGIGCTPAQPLQVNGGATSMNLALTNSTTGQAASRGLTLVEVALDAYINNRENGIMYFYNNGAERMQIAADGKVGIGCTPSMSILDVKRTTAPQACFFGKAYTSGGTNDYDGSIQLGNTDAYAGRLIYDGAGVTNLYIDNTYNTATSGIVLRTAGATRATINSTGLWVGAVSTTETSQIFAMNLVNNAKFELIEDINQLVGTANIKGLWIFDQTGATTSITDRSPNAHTLTLGQNASLCSPGVAGLCPNLTTAAAVADIWNVSDNDDFSFTDGAGNDTACTMLFLAYPDIGSLYAQIAKYNATGNNGEYIIFTNTGPLVTRFYTLDCNNYIQQSTDANLPTGWSCFGFTYDGSESEDGIISYVNGVAVAQTGSTVGTYTGMGNGTCNVMNAYNATSGRGKGKYGVILVINKLCTAAETKRLSQRLQAYAGSFI